MKLLILTAAVAAALILATAAAATGGLTKKDRDVIRFFQHHPRLAHTAEGGRVLARVLPDVVRTLASAKAKASDPYTVPQWWTDSPIRECIARAESGDGTNPAAHGNIYGMLSPGIWGDYGYGGEAGDFSREVQTYVAYIGYERSGCHGPWGRYDGCC